MPKLHVISTEEDQEVTAGGDPWETAGGYADQSKYYTQATNWHDHSGSVRYNESTELIAAIAKIVEHNPVYTTMSDFHRNWDVHGVHYENEVRPDALHDPQIRELLNVLQGQEEQQQLGRIANESSAYVEATKKTLSELYHLRDGVGMQRSLRSADARLAHMRPPYRQRLRKVINRYDEKCKVINGIGLHRPTDDFCE